MHNEVWCDILPYVMHPTFTTHWFSRHEHVWHRIIGPLKGAPNLCFLEIGSWEGQSACWLIENILTNPTSTLTCIDTFTGSIEHVRHRQWSRALPSLEATFDRNIAAIDATEKVIKHKGKSRDVLPSLPTASYDVIYVDGSHMAKDVFTDAIESWRLLRVSGVLAFDDYRWGRFRKPQLRPKPAIDTFLALHAGEYDLLHKGRQVIIRKRA